MDMRYILSLLILLSLAGIATAVPPLPDEFAGNITLDGNPAPAGTNVIAKINWNERGSTVVKTAGEYGPLDSSGVLAVKAIEDDLQHSSSPNITFWVNGHRADQEVEFIGGTVRRLDLSAVTGGGGVPVPIASSNNSFDIRGVEVTATDAGQHVVIDNSAVLGDITTNETSITLTNVEGWEEVVIFTKGKPTGDIQVTGVIESIHARSSSVNAESGWAQIDLEMSKHPGSAAQLDMTIFQKPRDDEKKAFEMGRNIKSFAYVLDVQKVRIANEGDSGVIRAATIRMAASPKWVDDAGGEDNILILRRADGGTTAVLETRYAGTDTAGNYVFEGVSLGGLSMFALVATGSSDNGSGSSGSSTGSGSSGRSSKDPGSQIIYDPDALDVHIESALLSTSLTGVVLESVTVITADERGAVTIPEGIIALDSAGNALGKVTCTKVATNDIPAITTGTMVSSVISCGPKGATFDSPVLLTYALSDEEWAKFGEGVTPKVMWFNQEVEEWVDVPATVDSTTRTITAEVGHFNIYALAWITAEAVISTPQDISTPVQEPVGEPEDAFPVWALAVVVMLLVALVALLVVRKK